MRVIEEKVIEAITSRKNLKHGKSPYYRGCRDEVTITEDGYEVALWGHIIAERKGNRLELCDCGYATTTTASRLNATCYAEKLPVKYCYGKGGYFITHDGTEFNSGHIVWDFSKRIVVEE